MSDEQSHTIHQFNLTFAVDRDGFFRRTCPNCGRDFKTQIDESELVISLQPTFRQMGLEIGATPDRSKIDDKEYLFCPYCNHKSEASETHTSTFLRYVKNHLNREYVQPQIHRLLTDSEDSFRKLSNRSTKGLFSISLKFNYDKPLLPPRPISGPEPPDMTILEFLCCNKRAKVINRYTSIDICPYCGTPIKIQ